MLLWRTQIDTCPSREAMLFCVCMGESKTSKQKQRRRIEGNARFFFSFQTNPERGKQQETNEARKERRREVTTIFYGRQPTAQEKLAITQVARMFVVVSGGVEHPRAGLHTVSNWPGNTEPSMAHSSILRSSTTEGTPRTRREHLERSSMMSASLDSCQVRDQPKMREPSTGKGLRGQHIR